MYTLSIGYFCLFQDKLHQSTNTYNYYGNGSTVRRSACSNPDEHIAITILILCSSSSSDIKTKVFLQTKKVTAL